MRYDYFLIQNFKGIENVKLDLTKIPKHRVYTLVGLNESGKTTILEAINSFASGSEDLGPLQISSRSSAGYHDLIPMSKRDNFNSTVSIKVGVTLDDADEKEITKYALNTLGFKSFEKIGALTITQKYLFENSNYKKKENVWDLKLSGRKPKQRSSQPVSYPSTDWTKLVNHIETLLPSILYFPNFLFDFPQRIYLDPVTTDKEKHLFYSTVIQDILDSLGTKTTIETHIIQRVKSSKTEDKRNLQSLLLKMSTHVTDVVFGAWNEIFRRKLDKEIFISAEKDETGSVFLEFTVRFGWILSCNGSIFRV